jgi:hypothetical protein
MPLLYSLHLHFHYTCLVALRTYSLHVFNLGLNGETLLTQCLVYRPFDCAPHLHIRQCPNPDISEFLQDLGPHFLALTC